MNTLGIISKSTLGTIGGRPYDCLFLKLFYPEGATGLTVAISGWGILKRRAGQENHYYVVRYVRQSRDYVDNWGEARCGVTVDFVDTYWPKADTPCKSLSEAKMLWYQIVSNHKRNYL